MDARGLTDTEWAQLLQRAPLDGWYGVKTTGIYCRFGCPSRPPNRHNAVWFPDAKAAEAGGFRACKRCGRAD